LSAHSIKLSGRDGITGKDVRERTYDSKENEGTFGGGGFTSFCTYNRAGCIKKDIGAQSGACRAQSSKHTSMTRDLRDEGEPTDAHPHPHPASRDAGDKAASLWVSWVRVKVRVRVRSARIFLFFSCQELGIAYLRQGC
jgi:hypothetical protein